VRVPGGLLNCGLLLPCSPVPNAFGDPVEGSVIAPGGETQRFRLRQEAPGSYRGRFDAPQAGTYVASARLTRPGDREGTHEVVELGRTKGPCAEYVSLDLDRKALGRLADLAGGEASRQSS